MNAVDPNALFAGVDPGLSGAMAIIDHQGRILALADLPTEPAGKGKRIAAYEAAELLSGTRRKCDACPGLLALEWVASRPGQGVASTFAFGRAFGAIEAVVTLADFPCELVAPATWKKAFGLLGADKAASIARAKALFPAASLERKKDHGKAEALLLAEYARRKWHGGG
jgi:crossover junction endodeoxyribonuclease RuvC